MRYILITFLLLILGPPIFADEGMWPLTEIHRLQLNQKGLEIPVGEIFNPDGVSLVNGIVRLSGCTASFVSADGLILTNHHCAFGAIQRASSEKNDYLTNGFMAADRSAEIPAQGYTASFIETYRDVSDEVLSVVHDNMSMTDVKKAIDKKTKEIILAAEKEFPGKRAEIGEMFIGKTYYLFIYTRLTDIRLVYAPPRSIGEFGGETDNWIWPRHTGDFSFVRAYVAPDGSPADYSEDNVPYKPKRFFQVAPEGVAEGDFVFIFGYPGRTYRHRTSYYLDYEEKIRMPYVADLYEWWISVLEGFSEEDKTTAIRVSSKIKGLANRMKNYRGKLTGMRRIELAEKRYSDEQKLQQYIENNPVYKVNYGMILGNIEKLYQEKTARAQQSLVLTYLIDSSTLLRNAKFVIDAAENRLKEDIERDLRFMDRNYDRYKRRLFLGLRSYHAPSDRIVLTEMIDRAGNLPDDQRIGPVDEIFYSPDAITAFLDQLYESSQLADRDFLTKLFEKSLEELAEVKDPALEFVFNLKPVLDEVKKKDKAFDGALRLNHGKLIDIKKEFYQRNFVPDANRTLRLTYGTIRGYSPRDAVYCSPITTFSGVVEKTTGVEPFVTPEGLLDLYRKKDFGQFKHPEKDDVPVAILYDMDTTGGNSGSPIFNARGQLIGVNFDRAWEATINDYAWNESYSRSIGVDIRYVLWVTQKFGGADHLLQEMNVPLL